MLEIYTPEEWRATFFQFSSITVDDEGLIYNSDDYHRKLIRNPVGKIDYSSGFIYGEDYLNLMRTPIGKIQQDGDVTMIFGEDYHSLSPTPILYIRDNEVYSYEQYHKLFPTPSYYIKSDSANNSSSTNPAKSNTINNLAGNEEKTPGVFSELFELLKPLLIVLGVGALGVYILWYTMGDSEYMPMLLIAIAVGFVSALIIVKNNSIFSCVLYTEIGSVITFWCGVIGIDYSSIDDILDHVISILLEPLLIVPMMAVPSIIVGLIAYLIKKLFGKLFRKAD